MISFNFSSWLHNDYTYDSIYWTIVCVLPCISWHYVDSVGWKQVASGFSLYLVLASLPVFLLQQSYILFLFMWIFFFVNISSYPGSQPLVVVDVFLLVLPLISELLSWAAALWRQAVLQWLVVRTCMWLCLCCLWILWGVMECGEGLSGFVQLGDGWCLDVHTHL